MPPVDCYIPIFDKLIADLFSQARRLVLKDPKPALFFLQVVRWQTAAARQRDRLRASGLHVPPFMIFSVTDRCNLQCAGCYARELRPAVGAELTDEAIGDLFDQADELGLRIALLGGGEPLTRRTILEIAAHHPRMIFGLFTNGLLLDQAAITRLKTLRHIIPILSLDGHAGQTDDRRGCGTHAGVLARMHAMKAAGIFFGTSLTVTRENLNTLTSEAFIAELVDAGCRLFFLVEYVPVDEASEHRVPTAAQREQLECAVTHLRDAFPALFISFPAGEEKLGGCLSAGRGFVHVSAQGDLEPCPFAPFSDVNLRETPLREALQSNLLETIRNSRERLEETSGGCALWRERAWVRGLVPLAKRPRGDETAPPQ